MMSDKTLLETVIEEMTKSMGRKPTDDEVLWVFKNAGVEMDDQ